MTTPAANPSAPVRLAAADLKAASAALQRIEAARQNYGEFVSFMDRKAAKGRLETAAREANPDFGAMLADGCLMSRSYRESVGPEVRRFFKATAREVLSAIAPVIAKAVGKQADMIRGQCAALQAVEEAASSRAGVSFEPSNTLARLRQSAARSQARSDQLCNGTSCSETELRSFIDGGSEVATAPPDTVPKSVREGVTAG